MTLAFPANLSERYTNAQSIGAGGMATAFVAFDSLRGDRVVVKILKLPNPDLVAAFRAEFSLLAALVHPSLPRVHDFGAVRHDSGPVYYYTSDLIDGQPIDRFAEVRAWNEVKTALCDAIEGLVLLHRIGFRHGDVTPPNILVSHDSRGYLIDLGCAQPLVQSSCDSLWGTPGYLAPEVLSGGSSDARADLYSLGVTLGKVLEALANPSPKEVAQLARRLVADNPQDRPSSATEVVEALGIAGRRAFLPSGEPIRFIGRSDELAQLRGALDRLVDGTPGKRVVTFQGPDGVGRSRLLREFKWMAQVRCRVVEGFGRILGAVESLLRRATGIRDLSAGIAGVWRARTQLISGTEPCVLILDDVHLLTKEDQAAWIAWRRSVEPTDPILVVSAGGNGQPSGNPEEEVCQLRALDEDQVRAWARDRLAPSTLPALMRLTGGYPKQLKMLLSRLGAGDSGEQDLQRIASHLLVPEQWVEDVCGLEVGCQRALGLCAAMDGRLADSDAEPLGVARETIGELIGRGYLQRESGGCRLLRTADAGPLLQALGSELSTELHGLIAKYRARELEQRCDGQGKTSELAACAIYHFAASGQTENAASLMRTHQKLVQASPQAWGRAADALRGAPVGVETKMAIATIDVETGHADRALQVLEPMLEEADSGVRAEMCFQVGSCYLKRSELAAATCHLEEAVQTGRDGRQKAKAAALLALAQVLSQNYEQARGLAQQALQWTDDASIQADLHESIGVANSYLGVSKKATEQLALAAKLQEKNGSPRAQVRTRSYQAIHAYHIGQIKQSADGHRQAMEVAERNGLSDYVANTALNLGTACHQMGEWAEAIGCYEKGWFTAEALGQLGTAAACRGNLAQLYTDIGLFERANQLVEQTLAGAAQAGLRLYEGLAKTVRGQILSALGRSEEALTWLEEAKSIFENGGGAREQAEVQMHQAEVEVQRGEWKLAGEALERARKTAAGLQAADLDARLGILHAHLLLHRDEHRRSCRVLEDALEHARRSGQGDLEAIVESALSAAWGSLGASVVARQHRERARALWERAAATLPAHLHEAFWRHPKRASVDAAAAPEPGTRSERERKLEQLLQVYRKLNSSWRTADVLECSMDAAIELTGAERGFILIRESEAGRWVVPVARNIDREKVGHAQSKFSHGIAQRVVETGEPIVAMDAQADARFHGNESVHAMRLRSVIAVPIRSVDGVHGALYLDNRFQRGRFIATDVELLVAFSDQVALTLRNARLMDELERRTVELEAERKRVEALMAGQVEKIDRLEDQVRHQQSALEHRYDYSQIVGDGPAMQRLFATLNRIIDTPLSVLIEGESGTGKELIAKAIHYNGPKKQGPFVAINCAALPESLLESELFGNVRGAFTGADRTRTGLMVSASGGTLFLDEIGEIPQEMQAKLLRVLQEREVRPLGGLNVVPVDFRLVCATNRNLRNDIQTGRFREDLYYRIGVVEIAVPALRDRPEDIPSLVRRLLDRIASELGREVPEVDPQAMLRLVSYQWPGNVRQLENVLSKACLLSGDSRLTCANLELGPTTRRDRPKSRGEFTAREADKILEALELAQWNVAEAARRLGIPRATMYRKLQRHGFGGGPR